MKITFTDMQDIAQEIVGLDDAATLTKLKRDINIGATKLLAALGREYNRKARFTDLVADQQFYQFSEDAHKLKEVIVSSGGWDVPLEQIPNEHMWRMMNMTNVVGQPTHFFVKGYDEVGLYPIPSANVTDGIELVFSPRHVEMTQDDYTTPGTLTVTNGSQTVTGSGTTFTSKLVGQWLQTTDGTDGNWYKVQTFNSTTSLTLENYYQGTSGAAKTFRIGQTVDIPEEFAEAPSDYACHRFYLRRDPIKAKDFLSLFQAALDTAREQYGTTTDQAVIYAELQYRTYNPFAGDPPPNGITA
jgi:hypothetical protein